jgi:hypothetical protein
MCEMRKWTFIHLILIAATTQLARADQEKSYPPHFNKGGPRSSLSAFETVLRDQGGAFKECGSECPPDACTSQSIKSRSASCTRENSKHLEDDTTGWQLIHVDSRGVQTFGEASSGLTMRFSARTRISPNWEVLLPTARGRILDFKYCGRRNGWSGVVAPDFWVTPSCPIKRFNFGDGCKFHDGCYGQLGRSKESCDSEAYAMWKKSCKISNLLKITYPPCIVAEKECQALAAGYHKAIAESGTAREAYEEGQRKARGEP